MSAGTTTARRKTKITKERSLVQDTKTILWYMRILRILRVFVVPPSEVWLLYYSFS